MAAAPERMTQEKAEAYFDRQFGLWRCDLAEIILRGTKKEAEAVANAKVLLYQTVDPHLELTQDRIENLKNVISDLLKICDAYKGANTPKEFDEVDNQAKLIVENARKLL